MSKKLLSNCKSSAVFSPCRIWRYTLTRQWDPGKPSIVFIGLNPSTATETEDDPTIRRCINFAKSWGYGTYVMCNMFGFRSTDPSILTNLADPNGPDNDHWIRIEAEKASAVVVAWGCHKMTRGRAGKVLSLIQNPLCLGTTHNGSPRHPLYVLGTRKPEPYSTPKQAEKLISKTR